jgi:hypothetical protein
MCDVQSKLVTIFKCKKCDMSYPIPGIDADNINPELPEETDMV